MPDEVPSAPPGLRPAGAALWTSVVDEFELAPHELLLLTEVCRTVDAVEALQARLDAADVLDVSPHGVRVNPCLPELRAQRLALGRLLAQLQLPVGLESNKPRARRERWPNLTAVGV